MKVVKKAYRLIDNLLDNPVIGLNSSEKIITRIFLTSSNHFKESLINDNLFASNLKNDICYMLLPKFIWVCELYTEESFAKDECIGLILIDPTGKPNYSSVLLYILNQYWIIKDNLLPIIEIKNEFSKTIYKHNLKGGMELMGLSLTKMEEKGKKIQLSPEQIKDVQNRSIEIFEEIKLEEASRLSFVSAAANNIFITF